MPALMHPDRLRQLDESAMIAELKSLGLSVTEILGSAYASLYKHEEGKRNMADGVPAPLTTTGKARRSRLTFPPGRVFAPKHAKVSGVMEQCLNYLDYDASEFYELKPDEEDLSEWLRPLWFFAWSLMQLLYNWDLDPTPTRSHKDIRESMRCNALKPLAKDELALRVLAPFYAGWDIEIELGEHDVGYLGSDYDNGPYDPKNKTHARDAAAIEERRKALLAEVDIFSFAVQERLNKWYRTFPKPAPEDALWPRDFTGKEQLMMKQFVRPILNGWNPWGSESLERLFKDILDHEEFPDLVPHAKHLRSIEDICAHVMK